MPCQEPMQSPAAEFWENVEIKQLDIFLSHWKVVLCNRAPLYGPAVSGHLLFGLDQPKRGTSCKPLLDVSASLLRVPEGGNFLEVLRSKLDLFCQPIDSHGAGDRDRM